MVKYKDFLCDCGCPGCKYNAETIGTTLSHHNIKYEPQIQSASASSVSAADTESTVTKPVNTLSNDEQAKTSEKSIVSNHRFIRTYGAKGGRKKTQTKAKKLGKSAGPLILDPRQVSATQNSSTASPVDISCDLPSDEKVSPLTSEEKTAVPPSEARISIPLSKEKPPAPPAMKTPIPPCEGNTPLTKKKASASLSEKKSLPLTSGRKTSAPPSEAKTPVLISKKKPPAYPAAKKTPVPASEGKSTSPQTKKKASALPVEGKIPASQSETNNLVSVPSAVQRPPTPPSEKNAMSPLIKSKAEDKIPALPLGEKPQLPFAEKKLPTPSKKKANRKNPLMSSEKNPPSPAEKKTAISTPVLPRVIKKAKLTLENDSGQGVTKQCEPGTRETRRATTMVSSKSSKESVGHKAGHKPLLKDDTTKDGADNIDNPVIKKVITSQTSKPLQTTNRATDDTNSVSSSKPINHPMRVVDTKHLKLTVKSVGQTSVGKEDNPGDLTQKTKPSLAAKDPGELTQKTEPCVAAKDSGEQTQKTEPCLAAKDPEEQTRITNKPSLTAKETMIEKMNSPQKSQTPSISLVVLTDSDSPKTSPEKSPPKTMYARKSAPSYRIFAKTCPKAASTSRLDSGTAEAAPKCSAPMKARKTMPPHTSSSQVNKTSNIPKMRLLVKPDGRIERVSGNRSPELPDDGSTYLVVEREPSEPSEPPDSQPMTEIPVFTIEDL